jgi:cyanophycinase-like exopeptidase
VSRVLTIMGSGETAPTMVKVHRMLLERVGAPAVLLDTPYGFQENADDISARAQQYFAQSVGHPIAVASFPTADVDAVTHDRAMARVAAAAYVFAGPGSPTYALRQWVGTPLPGLLATKLREAGGVTFASAAALTLGIATVPVYEIYKAGETPNWRVGLNLLEAATGLRAAVIPHYDNAEGGHHDTRYCYLGERRLAALEPDLPPGTFVLGVDEHTGLVLDLDARRASVVGNGVVTVRVGGHSTTFASGEIVGFDALETVARGEPRGPKPRAPESARAAHTARSPLLDDAARLEEEFTGALERRDVTGAVNAVLELDRVIVEWSADTLQSDEPDQARATLRSMIVRLGELAELGARDPRALLAPFVDALLDLRERARAGKDFALSDAVRERLDAAGIEVRDTAQGVTWEPRA